jgi:hypothetical protein
LAISTQGGPYSNDEFAMKNASSELRALKEFIHCNVKDLRYELVAMLDYKGFRALCFSELPILPDETIAYGSHGKLCYISSIEQITDGGQTFYDDEVIREGMKQIAKMLNIKEHYFRGTDGKLVMLYSSGDIEGHRATDGRLYVLDLSRAFPPEFPSSYDTIMNTINVIAGQAVICSISYALN